MMFDPGSFHVESPKTEKASAGKNSYLISSGSVKNFLQKVVGGVGSRGGKGETSSEDVSDQIL